MHRNRRAKIVATVGPASASPEMLKELFLARVDTFRMNHHCRLGAQGAPPHAVAVAAAGLAGNIGAAAIVAFASSGTTAGRIARKRPNLPILAITPNLRVARQMALLGGAHSVHGENSCSFEQMLAVAEATVRREAFARAGDTVVVVAGIPFGHAGSTNNIHVARV